MVDRRETYEMNHSYAFGMASVVLLWLAAIAACLTFANADPIPSLAHPAVTTSAQATVAFWFAAAALMLILRPEEWIARSGRMELTRLIWTLGLAMYVAHMLFAVGMAHGWSHDAAMQHVANRGGSGAMIASNYMFAIVWAGDAVWWWLNSSAYASRPSWIRLCVHGFMTFITFNATVGFGPMPVAIVSAVGFLMLAAMVWIWKSRRSTRIRDRV